MDDTFTDEDEKTLDEFTLEPNTTAIERAPRGRFAKGNKEGRKFQKGYSGKPKGSRNRKTLLAREFAMDVLKAFGFDKYEAELSTWDGGASGKYDGSPDQWALAEKALTRAVARLGINAPLMADEAAFYGPKIDFVV